MRAFTIAVVGAGERGTRYARYLPQWADRVRVVGVAEPRDMYRDAFAREYGLTPDQSHTDWRALLGSGSLPDALIIATPDSEHVEPAVAFLGRGCSVLLEKPMAPSEAGCRRIVEAAMNSNGYFGVCHVLRYTDFTTKLKGMLDQGAIGEIVSMQRLEPVGYTHQAHSFVRGNWSRESESSPMLLAKSCHDLDWIRYIMGARCQRVHSFGGLYHFRREQKPTEAGSATRCIDCDYESRCVYSAKRIYLEPAMRGEMQWPVSVLAAEGTVSAVSHAITYGPYGRCVYECENDVVDHQIVNLEFEHGRTAGFTMTAFTRGRQRETRLFGTRGEIYGNDEYIELFDFATGQTSRIETQCDDIDDDDHHGGGDRRIVQHFVRAVSESRPDLILSGPRETLESHRIVFAAEESRRTGEVVCLGQE